MPRCFAFLSLFLPLFTVVAAAPSRPGVLHLSQDEAVRMALAKNFSIEVQRFDPRIARQSVERERGRFDPSFDVSLQRGENTQHEIFSSGSLLTTRSITRDDGLSTGLSGLTPWGMTYDVGVGTHNRPVSGNGFENTFNSSLEFGLVQPLLRGFGPAANLAAVRVARNNVLVSEWRLRQQIIDVVTRTDFVYNELHLAQENLRVAERSRELALQLLADNSKRAQIGVMSPLNVTTARAEAAARQESVILARRDVKDNENLLKQLVTHDLEAMLSIQVEIEPPSSPAFRADVPAGINQALKSRPDYQEALLQIHNRHITLALTKNSALPRLDVKTSLNLLGLDNGFGGSFSSAANRDRTEWTAAAIFSVPIPNREGKASVASAQLEAAQAILNLQAIEQNIVVEVDNASGQIVTSRERIVSNAEALTLAQESLDAGQERLKAGTGTTFEVLELQKKLAEAEAASLRARSDYNKAVSEYRRKLGTSLEIYNVSVK